MRGSANGHTSDLGTRRIHDVCRAGGGGDSVLNGSERRGVVQARMLRMNLSRQWMVRRSDELQVLTAYNFEQLLTAFSPPLIIKHG